MNPLREENKIPKGSVGGVEPSPSMWVLEWNLNEPVQVLTTVLHAISSALTCSLYNISFVAFFTKKKKDFLGKLSSKVYLCLEKVEEIQYQIYAGGHDFNIDKQKLVFGKREHQNLPTYFYKRYNLNISGLCTYLDLLCPIPIFLRQATEIYVDPFWRLNKSSIRPTVWLR